MIVVLSMLVGSSIIGIGAMNLSLAGGGNAGTVWYNNGYLEAAIAELKSLDPDRFADLTIETFWGGGESGSNGWSFEGWVQLSVE